MNAKDIGVSTDQGVVTLRGTVPSYSEKLVTQKDSIVDQRVTRVDVKAA